MLRSSNNFTLLRLVLSVLVVLGHLLSLPRNGASSVLGGYADFAVFSFFVVSGYLLAGSYERDRNVIAFYIKRFFRVYPLYSFVIVIQLLAMVSVLPHRTLSAHNILRYAAANLLFLNFLQYDIGHLFANLPVPGINPSLWTLKIEVAFYALFPLIWGAYRRFGLRFQIGLFLLSTAFYVVCTQLHHAELAKQLPGQLRYFLVGTVLYSIRGRFLVSPRTAGCLAIVMFAGYAMLDTVWVNLVGPLLIGAFVFFVATRLPMFELHKDISFGIYLLHAPLIQGSLLLGCFSPKPWFTLLLLSAVCLLALFAERAIERPGIAAGRCLLNGVAKPAPADA